MDDATSACQRAFSWTSVDPFKGLESKVVILIEVDHITSDLVRMARYVGISRANSLLSVIWTKEAENEFQKLAAEFAKAL